MPAVELLLGFHLLQVEVIAHATIKNKNGLLNAETPLQGFQKPLQRRGVAPIAAQHRQPAVVQRRGLVGPAGFEPATSSTPRKRATKLRYGPNRCPGDNHSVPKGVPPTAD